MVDGPPAGTTGSLTPGQGGVTSDGKWGKMNGQSHALQLDCDSQGTIWSPSETAEKAQIKEATLENRAAIAYLLLRHNNGCEAFQGMCCFNLSGNSQLVEEKIQTLKDSASKFNESEGMDLSWLTAPLPNLNCLKQLFLGHVLMLIIFILNCCMIQSLPFCLNSDKQIIKDENP
ncbi:hypothetical protein llap_21474 [Limosa lapponica baueri]|uniref:Uncharacterized protein n=1 Tax=Limosa lapponica baueri TaxID=1758121 RepID=A0A2I0T375_LIMLA|nr:hypothetical protein llap_21474 [Limosa lapponica baueri]